MSDHVPEQSGSEAEGMDEEEKEEEEAVAVNSTRCVSAHFSPLTGEIEGRTGQRRDSSRAAGPQGLRFGDVELLGLGQDDQVAEGKVTEAGRTGRPPEDGSASVRERVSGCRLCPL